MRVEKPRVFLNYCEGKNVYFNRFIVNIVGSLQRNKINVFIDKDDDRGQELELQLKRIAKARIALVIFSARYTKSTSCLRELAKINDCVEKGKLVAIPIFYKLDPFTVKRLAVDQNSFAQVKSDATKKIWKKALLSITEEKGIIVDKNSPSIEKINEIVEKVKERLNICTPEENQEPSVDLSENSDTREKDRTSEIKKRLDEMEKKINGNKTRMKIASLLLLVFYLPQIAYMSAPLIFKGGAINGTVENEEKMSENSSSDAKTNGDYFHNRTCPNRRLDGIFKPPKIQVFINFRGKQVRNCFIGFLVDALQRSDINVFIDNLEQRGEDLNTLFNRIEDSGIAIVVFSSQYTESNWCLEELVKIKECVQQGMLKVLPIFYKVTPDNVKRLKGEFGDHFRDKEHMYAYDEPKIKRWKEAIAFISQKHALIFHEISHILENDFVRTVVEEVLKILQAISTGKRPSGRFSWQPLLCEKTKLKLKL